ncbi:MAG: DUF1697 domain-containing protein [Bacteroidales bacterium]|nr:DUF1697 domain-containing protein [Bacteroidales bacterium]
MKYIALLRGINVGKSIRVDMKALKTLFEALGYTNVSTYINSGNIIFESDENQDKVLEKIITTLKKEFNADIPTLVMTIQEMKAIAEAIPDEWLNDATYKTDVAYLFPQIDSEKTINELPLKKEFLDIRYVKGAIFWNVDRNNYNKSQLNKIISHRYYQLMTVRNVNTARFLAGEK